MKIRGFEIVSVYKSADIHLPQRKTGASTGYDFAAAEAVAIPSGECALVPTGVKAYMQPDEVLLIYIRSSTALKKRLMLMNSVGVIDADYYGNAENEGHIYIDKEEITSYPVYKRARAGIGYLPQEASVFRKMSVEDNIMSVLEMTGKPQAYQQEKLESLIREFRLTKVRKNKGDQLSGGERRRTEIARCLAIDPKFIMLDEPFAGVDPIAVEDIQHIVWQLKYRNIGILITDHNVQETLTITDRAYLLFEGRILFQGAPEELAENKIVREKYLSNSFVLRKKDFQTLDEERKARENS